MSPFNFGPPPYPLEKFHFLVRETAYELSQHLQAPDALIGMSLLAVMSAACQGRIDVKLPTGQVRPVSLNILAIAESGERKSALDSLAAKPLYDLVERRQDAHELETEQYEHDLAMWEDAAKVLLKKRAVRIRKVMSTEEVTLELTKHRKSKPVPPRMRQLVRHDLSGRAFADALHGDGESLALMSAEGDVLLRSGAMKQLGWLNSVWDGSTLTLDRADGKGVVARNPRVTVSIMAQPSAFHQHLARHGEQARGTGLLARFLVGWPTSTQGTRFLSGTEPSWEKLSLFHERVTKLLDEYDASLAAGCNQRMTIAFTEDAKYRWIEFVNHAEQLISPQEDFHHVSDHVSKVSEIIGRLAAILHHFSLQEGDITIDTLERAVAIVTWHVDEFRRLFSPTSDVSLSHGDAYDLARHLHEKVWLRRLTAIRRNQLLRSGPVRLRTKRRLEPALDVLIGIGAVSLDRNGNGPCYLDLNPKFFGSFSAF